MWGGGGGGGGLDPIHCAIDSKKKKKEKEKKPHSSRDACMQSQISKKKCFESFPDLQVGRCTHADVVDQS